jgi:hypothetical protein
MYLLPPETVSQSRSWFESLTTQSPRRGEWEMQSALQRGFGIRLPLRWRLLQPKGPFGEKRQSLPKENRS